jgi:hypothetical protein
VNLLNPAKNPYPLNMLRKTEKDKEKRILHIASEEVQAVRVLAWQM